MLVLLSSGHHYRTELELRRLLVFLSGVEVFGESARRRCRPAADVPLCHRLPDIGESSFYSRTRGHFVVRGAIRLQLCDRGCVRGVAGHVVGNGRGALPAFLATASK